VGRLWNGDGGGGAGVDLAGAPVDGDFLPGVQHGGGVAGADDAGQLQFAGDDRGVAGDAASVGDQRGGASHGWYPVRAGHLSNQDLTVYEVGLLVGGGEDAHSP
jgi:hypothetical protein